MARAKVLGGSGTRLNVWIDTDADRMLHEMLDAWYPGYTRVQGAVVTRAITLLYGQFQCEQRAQRDTVRNVSSASRSGREGT